MTDAELMKAWRKVNKFSQAEAADFLGYRSYMSISLIETKRRPMPNWIKRLMKMQLGGKK